MQDPIYLCAFQL